MNGWGYSIFASGMNQEFSEQEATTFLVEWPWQVPESLPTSVSSSAKQQQ